MNFVCFMRSLSGRLLRIVAGTALIAVGLFVVKDVGGLVLAAVGLVPLSAGIFNPCLFGPLMGLDFMGNRRAPAR